VTIPRLVIHVPVDSNPCGIINYAGTETHKSAYSSFGLRVIYQTLFRVGNIMHLPEPSNDLRKYGAAEVHNKLPPIYKQEIGLHAVG
jgi:hypothetical protein